jgi:hypothetical protein
MLNPSEKVLVVARESTLNQVSMIRYLGMSEKNYKKKKRLIQ